jgi:hypothetical protein
MAKSRDARRVAPTKRCNQRSHPARGGVGRIHRGAPPRPVYYRMPAALAANGAPEQVLEVLHAEGPVELLGQLGEAGLLSLAEEALGEVLSGWEPLLRRGCSPLEAEIAGAEALGMMRLMTPGDIELAELVIGMIEQAEAAGTAEALALISVLAVLGPGAAKPAASAAAARLAATGTAAPPWAAAIGQPEVGRCFGYADVFGEQQAIALGFTYGRKQHAVSVLIDHVLGGGVKDCFVCDSAAKLRVEYQSVARQPEVTYRDYSPAAAASILAHALAQEPCPEQPDQVEDVARHLALLWSRLELLSASQRSGR